MPVLSYQLLLYVLSCSNFMKLSDGLVPGGVNVCSKLRLSKVYDVYQSTWTTEWDCEDFYPEISCDRMRSGEVAIKSIYFLQEQLTCCPGWTQSEDGRSCNQPCQAGYFGENCAFKCRCFRGSKRSDCDVIDGTCDCLEGWKGLDCSERCSPGLYGPGCSLIAPFDCENGGTPHPTTGECLCRAGFDGLACEIICPTSGTECGYVLCESCIASNSQDCDPVFGACVCKNGWQGRYCSDPCPRGFDGHFCRNECCSQQGACLDGGCLCNDGYYGDVCQEKCPAGTFGRNCGGECACPSCDHVTGACLNCPAGFKGLGCTERCSPSEWGPNCTSPCFCGSTGACDVFSGQCVRDDEYEDDDVGDDENDSEVILIVIIITLACGLLAVLLCACVFCLRRNFDKNRTKPHSPPEHTGNTDVTRNNILAIGNHFTGPESRESSTVYHCRIHQTDKNSFLSNSNIEHHYYEDMEDIPPPPSRCARPQKSNYDNSTGELKNSAHRNSSHQYSHAIYLQAQ